MERMCELYCKSFGIAYIHIYTHIYMLYIYTVYIYTVCCMGGEGQCVTERERAVLGTISIPGFPGGK